MITYMIGCLVALILTMILDTIEYRSGCRKQHWEHVVLISFFTLISWVGVAIVAVGITLYIYDTYVEIYNES